MRAQERLTSKNRRKGKATNTTLQTNSQKANTMQTSRVKTSQIQKHHTVIWRNMEIDVWYFFFFSIFNYQLQQAPRKLNGSSVKSGIHKYKCKSTGIFFPPSQRER